MDNALMNMAIPEVDFDKLFSHRGGFALAYVKLLAYAITVIQKRSVPTKGGAIVAKMDAKELLAHAFSRLTEGCSFEDGEEVYRQLRRHIDNKVRTVQKVPVPPRHVSVGAGHEGPTTNTVNELQDENATNPASAAELSEEDDFNKSILTETKRKFKADGMEPKFIDILIEGWKDRPDVCELMNITPEQYDALLKRVSRAAKAEKEEFLKRKAL
jgi:hypothetical protein